ncbi:hypothetical protein RJ641_008073 [Dillenia turbinata]|uniref:DUF7963 domain-containing protein n=1 Tax=Dillenia turbinata TaxID=194707 RepID=A0AAN8Z4M9_9MAGN
MSMINSISTDADEIAARAVNKRYEGLVTVRTKAIKGKGAWYWAHLEPILVKNTETGVPKAVKLKCCLCNAVFSASNPSRTASEHLKRGTCSNFSSMLQPISAIPPMPISNNNNNVSLSPIMNNHRRKRNSSSVIAFPSPPPPMLNHGINTYLVSGDGNNSNCSGQHHLVLSGGREDLGALAMLEDSVKKLKSPKASPRPVLSKDQVDSALDLLANWFYESCGSVSFSSLEHPKFKAFLNQVGLPAVSRKELLGSRLDSKFEEVRIESEARIRDALFFQVACEGWKCSSSSYGTAMDENLVKFTVNLPNGTCVFQKAVFTGGSVPSKYAEDILWEMITGICGSAVQQCVGIVSDKAKALRKLEAQNHWMVNLSCQFQGFLSLIKDFSRELPLFKAVTNNCIKLANYFNSNSEVRNGFHKYQLQVLDHAALLRVPSSKCENLKNFEPVFALIEDIVHCADVLHLVVLDDSYKRVCVDDPVAREVGGMIQDDVFWNELQAVYSLVKLIKEMAEEIESERPLIGQCLSLWQDLRAKVKEWCMKFSIGEGPVEKIVDKRFKKNYHPAWSTALILDPLYLIRDTNGKYLPPFKCLTHEQEKDVDKLITRLVSREEAHIALMELMKWRSEGLDPLYAQAVQVKRQDPVTGKMKVANPQSSRLVWETCLSEFKSLGKVAVRLIFLHATSSGFKCNWSFMRRICPQGHSRMGIDRAQKMIFIAAHAKLGRRDFSNEEEKDAEMLAMTSSEDDTLNEVFAEASSV